MNATTGAGRSPADKGHGWPALGDPGCGGKPVEARTWPSGVPRAPLGALAVGPAPGDSEGLHIITHADCFLFTSQVQELPPASTQVNLTLPLGENHVGTPAHPRHYAKFKRVKRPHRKAIKRQHFPVTACRFREARLSCGLGIESCADLLQVSERTIRNWESSSARVPYAAYRLMRVMRAGKVLGPDWHGFHIWHGVLCTPEGHRFEPSDLVWQSLLVQQARAFREFMRERKTAHSATEPAQPALGLSLSPTREKKNDGAPIPTTTTEPERKTRPKATTPQTGHRLSRVIASLPAARSRPDQPSRLAGGVL